MTEDNGRRTEGGREVEAAANKLLEMFIGMLDTDAARTGDSVPIERVRQIAESPKENQEFVGPIHESAFHACFRIFEQGVWEDKRVNCLGRIIVHRFMHLVSSGENQSADSPKLTRPCIPGFIEILIMAIGRDRYDDCYERAQDIVAHLKQETGKQSVWDEFYVSAEGQDLVREFLLSMMEQFDDFEKRRSWFIEVMNTHLDHHHDWNPAPTRRRIGGSARNISKASCRPLHGRARPRRKPVERIGTRRRGRLSGPY